MSENHIAQRIEDEMNLNLFLSRGRSARRPSKSQFSRRLHERVRSSKQDSLLGTIVVNFETGEIEYDYSPLEQMNR